MILKKSKYTAINRNLSGWGNFPKMNSNVLPYSKEVLESGDNIIISRGLGRSYGDSSLNKIVVDTSSLDKFIEFDSTLGIIKCQAGISLDEILSLSIPKGWFLPVTPGTKFVTIGGAIAADVHGKNHHIDGSFCNYVISLNILIGTGEIINCSREHNRDLFYATCGGMGLTGIIIDASFTLKSIKSEAINVKSIKAKNLYDALEIFSNNKKSTYSVAWIDCLKKGKSMGRSIVMLGEHSKKSKPRSRNLRFNIPFNAPSVLLNKFSVKTFNTVYYNSQFNKIKNSHVHYDPFFYPLDSLKNWNRLYGNRGFFQYQFVVPFSVGFEGINKIFVEITNWGQASFLAVLKTFGKGNDNLLSFPMEGYTLAIDIKYSDKALKFFDRLDKIILEMGGRIYLAKDSRMDSETFKKSYKNWETFQKVRKKYKTLEFCSSSQSRRIGLNL